MAVEVEKISENRVIILVFKRGRCSACPQIVDVEGDCDLQQYTYCSTGTTRVTVKARTCN